MTGTRETQVGKWIAWNGGECPVHPKTIIEAARIGSYVDRREAGQFQSSNWTETGHSYSIVAYRIIKEYKEPRERFFIYDYDGSYVSWTSSERDARSIASIVDGRTYAKFREVIE